MIKAIGFSYEKFNFPCGETQVQVGEYTVIDPKYAAIHWSYENDAEFMELALLCDAFKRLKGELPPRLYIDYMPYSRQDRALPGESLAIKVACDFINNLGFETVGVLDPHSDVTTALLNNVAVTTQSFLFSKHFNQFEDGFYLICPDAGAVKKIQALAKTVNPLGIVYCTKHRDMKTGELTGTSIVDASIPKGQTCVIVDDICDGGRTFIEIAKLLRDGGAGKVVLMVTHGFFTKGFGVFDGLIDEIYTAKGKVFPVGSTQEEGE